MKKHVILEAADVSAAVDKLARQIIARKPSVENLLLVGIRTGGAYLAARLEKSVARLHGTAPLLGILDTTLYRDDWTKIGPTPVVGKTELPLSVDEKEIILVDDVLFTGRTARAAMDALMDFGRPKKIELAVLIDRGKENRELPIDPDYVAHVRHTADDETINVYLQEGGFADHVAVEEQKAA